MGATYTIEDFRKKYKMFSAPCYFIEINGKKLEEQFSNKSVTVEIPAAYEAGSCKFVISNAFETSKQDTIEINKSLEKTIKLGNIVEVLLGYQNASVKKVFFGYIDAIYVDYSKKEGEIIYTVECLDAKGIMMNSYRSEVKTSIKKYTQAVENVLKMYTKLLSIEATSIGTSDKELTTLIEQHNESDYDFVVRIAKILNYSFYIVNKILVFQPLSKKKDSSILFEFNINDYVESFSMYSTLKNQPASITVRANNEKDPTKPFEATVTNYKNIIDNTDTKVKAGSVITNNVSKTIIDPSVDSEETAKQRAEAKLNEVSYGLSKGEITIVGIPEFVPGKVVKLVGFGSIYNKNYYVTKVVHKIEDNEYTTKCELEVNMI
jgi:phage protein D